MAGSITGQLQNWATNNPNQTRQVTADTLIDVRDIAAYAFDRDVIFTEYSAGIQGSQRPAQVLYTVDAASETAWFGVDSATTHIATDRDCTMLVMLR